MSKLDKKFRKYEDLIVNIFKSQEEREMFHDIRQLSNDQKTFLIDKIVNFLARSGFNANWEPNRDGEACEELIDILSH